MFLNNLVLVIEKDYKKHIEKYKEKLINLNFILEENNYTKIISKGFITAEKEGELIKSHLDLSKNDQIVLKFRDGCAKVIVEEIF